MSNIIERARLRRLTELSTEQRGYVEELEGIFYPGSFLLSVNTLTGHMLVGMLKTRYDELNGFVNIELPDFVYRDPIETEVRLPKGHAQISNLSLQVADLWYAFLRCVKPPKRANVEEVEADRYYGDFGSLGTGPLIYKLIESVAQSDNDYVFPYNTDGAGSRVSENYGPSLLRSFVVEGRFPASNSPFYSWLMANMYDSLATIAKSKNGDHRQTRQLIESYEEKFKERNASFMDKK